MQLQKSELSLTVSGINTKEIEFDVDKENIGLILETLRSKMYADPILAICREVASNSRDANREVGNMSPTKIIVQKNSVWTENTPVIIFSDNGPGISPQRMVDVFVKFGASTKRHTNGLTGGFGYGAKTPFAYTDTFYIKTVVDGVEYVYVCALDESRRGKLILLTEEPSTEVNGTEIIIPLKSHDIPKFKQDVLFSTYFWDVRPVYVGFDDELQRYQNQIIYENTSKYYVGLPFAMYKGLYALIDGIPYAIGDSNFTHRPSYSRNQALIMFKFQNGVLPVSTNRETIIVNDASVATIEKARQHLLHDYRQKLNQTFDKLEADKNFHDMLFEFKKISEDNKSVFGIFGTTYSYKKYDSQCYSIFPLHTQFKQIARHSLYSRRNRGTTINNNFRDLMWHYRGDFSKLVFYINDVEPYRSRVITLHNQNINFCLVDMPKTTLSDLEAVHSITAMTEVEFETGRTTGLIPREFYNVAQFKQALELEKNSLDNFAIFCNIYKPTLLSLVEKYKAPRSTTTRVKTTTINISATILKIDGTTDTNGVTLDLAKKQLIDGDGKAYKGYVIWTDYTKAKFYENMYYTNKKIYSGWLPLFSEKVVFLSKTTKPATKIINEKYTVLSSRADFEKVVIEKNIIEHYLTNAKDNCNDTDQVGQVKELDKTFNFLSKEEKLITNMNGDRTVLVEASLIDLDWQKYNKLAQTAFKQQLKSLQCIIVKSKPLFVLNTAEIGKISSEKLEQIKQILLS